MHEHQQHLRNGNVNIEMVIHEYESQMECAMRKNGIRSQIRGPASIGIKAKVKLIPFEATAITADFSDLIACRLCGKRFIFCNFFKCSKMKRSYCWSFISKDFISKVYYA